MSETSRAFIDRVVSGIPGWLDDYAALRTADLLSYQEERSLCGSLLEIGVFHGKYLALLIRSALITGHTVVGVDTFQYIDRGLVYRALQGYFQSPLENVQLIKAASSEFDAHTLLERLGEKPRFISVDGSHQLHDVYLDLVVCESILSDEGIVALDDFLNPYTLGVNAAVHTFFSLPRRIVPFAYLSNKLFLSRPASAPRLRAFVERVSMEDEIDPIAREFQRRMQHDRPAVEQSIFGYPVLVAS